MCRICAVGRRAFIGYLALIAMLPLIPAAKPVHAATPNAYFVSLAGLDTNPGTESSPFRTFSKAVSAVQPGDSINIFGGTYRQRLQISRSGLGGAPITVRPVAGERVVIDLGNKADDNIRITGSYINVSGLEIRNSSGYCARLSGTHNTLKALLVHDCYAAGIFTDGQNETISNNTVFHSSAVNSSLSLAGGWGSGIKVGVGGNAILIARNKVYNNYGEGIAVTRGVNVILRANTVHDNYSVNIYVDNSRDVVVEKNFAFNRPNNGFERGGVPAENFALGQEAYGDWGAQLANITIWNNISYRGAHGITFYGNQSGAAAGGLKDTTIAFNTLWGSVYTEISLAYDAGQDGNLIANNIVAQSNNRLVKLGSAAGVTFSHNFWVNALPPWYARTAGDRTGDVKLASAPGYTAGTFRLALSSPAIDAATSMYGVLDDYSGGRRPSGQANDMGAYEYVAP